MILGRKSKIRRLNLSEDLFFFFLEITMILGQNWFYWFSKIMIWANVTKFGQNFIAPQNFLGWYGYGYYNSVNKAKYAQEQ